MPISPKKIEIDDKCKLGYIYRISHKTDPKNFVYMLVTKTSEQEFEGRTISGKIADPVEHDSFWSLNHTDLGLYWFGDEIGPKEDYPELML